METRANYALIGAFTLVGVLGAFLFLLWLAKIDVNRQFAYYDVLFDNVAGLGTAGSVRYNGLPVGQVVMLELDNGDPSKVRVRLELDAETPVKTDTVAQLQSQGVTGVSYVALSGGSATAPALERGGVIRSERSALQSIFEGAPELLEKAVALLEDVQEVVSDENKAAVSDLLANLSSASGRLDRALEDFETLSANLGEAAQEVAGFTGRLEKLSDTAEVTLNAATETLGDVRGTLESAETAFDTADGLMREDLSEFIKRAAEAATSLDGIVAALEPSAVAALDAAQGLIETRLPELVDQLQAAAEALETQVASVGEDASALMTRYEEVGAEVQARVAQAEGAITAFESASAAAAETLESVRVTSDKAGVVIEQDLRPLAGEATATLEAARGLAEDRLPGLIDQTNQTLATVDREVQAVSLDLREALDAGTARLEQAEATMAALDTALADADGMIMSLTETSESVGDIVRGDGAALVADARVAAHETRAAVETINAAVQADLPGLMEEVRGAAEAANRVINETGARIGDAATQVSSLTEDGRAALTSATEAFTNANDTLAAITKAMDAADVTLVAAEETFNGVNTLLDEDIDGIVADIKGAVAQMSETVKNVSGNIENASGRVLAASDSASNLIGTVDKIVQENRRQVSDFMRVGLPQMQRFVEESRLLVVNLQRLVDRVERDPARFLLGTQGSEFRR